MKPPAVVTLAGAALAVAALAGCSSAFSRAASSAASPKATSAQEQAQSSCMAQLAWNLNNSSAVKALYADTGAKA